MAQLFLYRGMMLSLDRINLLKEQEELAKLTNDEPIESGITSVLPAVFTPEKPKLQKKKKLKTKK